MPFLLAPENAVTVTRGVTQALLFTAKDSAGAILVLTGARIIFSVKEYREDRNVVLQKSTDTLGQISIVSAARGTFTVNLLPADTKNLKVESYFFDIWVVVTGGARYAVVPSSSFIVEQNITFIP